MKPEEVIDMFDQACSGLQISRQGHFQIQQIIVGIRKEIDKPEVKKEDDPKK